jgi:hypothetical protein
MVTFSPSLEDEPDLSECPKLVSVKLPSECSSNHQTPQEAEEKRRRKAELGRQLIGGPTPRPHPFREPELHSGIGKRRGVIGLDRGAQPVLSCFIWSGIAASHLR